MGAEKYGEFTWLSNDTLGMLMEELLDVVNYARYTFIRMYLLAEGQGQILSTSKEHKIPFGKNAFTPASGRD